MDWNTTWSHPSLIGLVTPCVGVWIETYDRVRTNQLFKSHPAWVCGLKQIVCIKRFCTTCHTLRGCVDWNWTSERYWTERTSHPAWVCGLKLFPEAITTGGEGHTLRGCVDWNIPESIELMISISHTLRGCVDWNTQSTTIIARMNCHTLRGCIWIEALFTRWSSLWKNCKHSASCVFLFKLL